VLDHFDTVLEPVKVPLACDELVLYQRIQSALAFIEGIWFVLLTLEVVGYRLDGLYSSPSESNSSDITS
jgi:hypothetical protein